MDIKKVSASGESGIFFLEAIHPYNKSRKDSIERFNIYNLEYEYWNERESLERHLNFDGFTYYNYGYLKYVINLQNKVRKN